MPDEPQHNRRWEDMERAAQVAARQEVAPFRLLLDQTADDVRELKSTVYGNPGSRRLGVVDRLDLFEQKIAQLGQRFDERFDVFGKEVRAQITELAVKVATQIDEGKARGNQIAGARKALYVLAGIIGIVGGLPALATFLKALGITP